MVPFGRGEGAHAFLHNINFVYKTINTLDGNIGCEVLCKLSCN